VVKPIAVLSVVVAVLGMRLLTHFLGWRTPTATDLTPLIAAAPKRVISTGGRAVGWAKRASFRRGEADAPDSVEPGEPGQLSGDGGEQHD